MPEPRPLPPVVRFGVFELDLRARELRKQGRRIHLQDKPFELLAVLVEHAGELVTRDALRAHLWPADTFVVFDDSLNTAVRKAREALGDVPGHARYIETVPRHGYRFVADIANGAGESTQAVASSGLPPEPDAAAPPPSPVAAQPSSVRQRRWLRRAAAAFAGAVLVIVAAIAGASRAHPRERRPDLLQFRVPAPPGTYFPAGSPQPALSPDGRRLAFLAGTPTDRVHHIWIQSLDSPVPTMVAGTEYAFTPFWSPDGSAIAFVSYGKLHVLRLATGRVTHVADATDVAGGAWSEGGTILFGDSTGALRRIGAAGDTPAPATVLDRTRRERLHAFPHFLPGGRDFLYVAVSEDPELSAIYVGSLDRPGRTRVIGSGAKAVFVPPSWLLFPRGGALVAQPFDAASGRLTGEPRQVAPDVSVVAANGSAAFSAASTGTVVYAPQPHDSLRELTWFDRSGRPAGTIGGADRYVTFDLSPDGRWIAAERIDPATRAPDIWVIDASNGSRWRATFNPANDERPVWGPDSRRFVYARHRGIQQIADLYVQGIDQRATPVPLYSESTTVHPTSWSRDGRYVLFDREEPSGRSDVWLARLAARGHTQGAAWLESAFSERSARVSPDGRWVAYASDESGRSEVYVRRFDGGGKRAVSSAGGAQPRWRTDGGELFFVSADERIMAVRMRPDRTAPADSPRALFALRRVLAGPYTEAAFAPSADGRRFLVATIVDDPGEAPMTVAVNLPAALEHPAPVPGSSR